MQGDSSTEDTEEIETRVKYNYFYKIVLKMVI